MATTRHAQSRDPPPLSFLRLLAGLLAGLVGGLAFGVLMIAPAIMDGGRGFEGMGMLSLMGRLLGTDSLALLWAVHLANAAFLGMVFSLFVAPTSLRRTIPFGLAWGVLLWLGGSFLLLRLAVGEPLAFTLGVLYNLLGHLAYGAALGVAYVAFFREESDLARDHPRVARRERPL